MIQRGTNRMSLRALVVDDELGNPTAEGRAIRSLVEELQGRSIDVVEATSAEDGTSVVTSDSAIHAVLIDWTLGEDDDHKRAHTFLKFLRSRNDKIPIFLMAERGQATDIPIDVMEMVDEFVWTLEDTAAFVGGRVQASIRRYIDTMMPPLAAAMMRFNQDHAYSWHTPGHAGGTAFLKSPVGRVFFDYYGENLLRSDLSISVGSLGSLLDHSGPMGEHERYAARVFGARPHLQRDQRHLDVEPRHLHGGGGSRSDRAVRSQLPQVDRAQPGHDGRHSRTTWCRCATVTESSVPIPPARLAKEAIKASIKANSLATKDIDKRAVYAVVTNSTYDGLCYNAKRVQELLDPSVDRIHFDEAWYAYARFNPIYRDRHAMHGDPKDHKGPTIFATHSTHKLLAALSQASFLHIRDGRGAIPHSRFNESFMMQASTSPLYPIIVSNDVTAAMMDGPGGLTLTNETIEEAIAFRQSVGRVHRQFAKKGEWFFKTWNAETVKARGAGKSKAGKKVRFEDASPEQLATDPQCWVLHPGETWHGFTDLEADYCMLDPIKCSIVTPGVADKGGLDKRGIPATLVTQYLHYRGVEVEKTTDFTILVLFSMGITKGRWGTLLNALLEFKRDYDRNAPIAEVLPGLVKDHPSVYGKLGLRELADQMFDQLKTARQTHWLAEAFSTLPDLAMSPSEAYQHLVRDEIEHVPLEELAGRILATSVVPYPPGIPMLMPGESTGADDGPYLGYLRALWAWDQRFPGFGHDTHGIETRDGVQYIQCLKADAGG